MSLALRANKARDVGGGRGYQVVIVLLFRLTLAIDDGGTSTLTVPCIPGENALNVAETKYEPLLMRAWIKPASNSSMNEVGIGEVRCEDPPVMIAKGTLSVWKRVQEPSRTGASQSVAADEEAEASASVGAGTGACAGGSLTTVAEPVTEAASARSASRIRLISRCSSTSAEGDYQYSARISNLRTYRVPSAGEGRSP